MLYDKDTRAYLTGENFSNAANINISSESHNVLYRDEYLLKQCKNKKILHIGFVDHLPLIDEKITRDKWLHKKLTDISDVCYGIDINKEGIEYLQEKYDYKNLYVVDILCDDIPQDILDIEFDYIVIPDVIEHIGNPVEFLQTIKTKFDGNVKQIIITTPNAFRLNNFTNVFKNKEVINSDHRFWFTPYSLSKILVDAKYEINSLSYCEHGKIAMRRLIRRGLLSMFPAFRDTLIIEVSLK